MQVRKINIDQDYDTLKGWWEAYGFPVVPRHALPKNGLIIDGLCAGFIYRTDSSIAWLEWLVGNKEADKMERKEAIQIVINELKSMAYALGYDRLFTSTVHPNLVQLYKDSGFLETDTNVTHFIGILEK